ncbi:MAG: hypothetical protein IKF68_05650 [Erysipelotrichaceae bacterium]|nr:hypothetical protein [Erysipelotrichaceae bacterium]
MINERGLRLGPLGLLLTVIAIALATLATLSFTSARADGILTDRFAETIRIRYSLDAKAQNYRYQNDDSDYSTVFEEDGYELKTAKEAGNMSHYCLSKIWNNDENIHDLWEGN